MATKEQYNEYLKYINLTKLANDYKLLGSYRYLCNVLTGDAPLSKAMEMKLQTVLLDFSDDQFIRLNSLLHKPIKWKHKSKES